MIKTCSRCGRDKALEHFYLQKRRSGKYSPMAHCKACHNGSVKRRVDNFTEEERERYLSAMLERGLIRKYGITEADYQAMLLAQGGVCKLCRKPEVRGSRLAVDHDHLTGEVRGLLCFKCNTRIGYFEHHDLMDALLAYLKVEVVL